MTTSRESRSGSQLYRGPDFGRWIWCVAVTILISLTDSHARCPFRDVCIEPPGTIRIQYGQPLEIYCTSDNTAAENLEFERDGTTESSEIVNSTIRKLYYEHMERGVYAFYCRNRETNRIYVTRVIVDTPPNAVTDFGCVSYNIEQLNCTWGISEQFSITNYSLSWLLYGDIASRHIASLDRPNKVASYSFSTNSSPRYKQMNDKFNFQLESCNYFGCIVQNFTIDHFAIVKPDPPINLRVLKTDSHSALLQWRIPNNLVDFMPCAVEHRIVYQRISGSLTSDNYHIVDTSNLPPKNKTYRFLIDNLPDAYRDYEVRVQIKSALDVDGKFWSDDSVVVFRTAGEAPRAPLLTAPGAFTQLVHGDKRDLYVYWQKLDEFEETGPNTTYKIQAKTPLLFSTYTKVNTSYVVLKDTSLEAIDISIWSVNAEGSSANSSHLHIPSNSDTKGLEIRSFTKTSFDNGTYLLSWEGVENIEHYTLFWCRNGGSNECDGRIEFIHLDSRKNCHVLDVPLGSQFALAAINGSRSGGMSWASWVTPPCGALFSRYNSQD